MAGLTSPEIQRIVNKYIGVFDGYLSDFTYRSHSDFYPEYCDLEVDTDQYEGTTRKKFIAILENSPPSNQAKILRGVLKRFPLDAQDKKPVTRNQELYDELVSIATRLEDSQGALVRPSENVAEKREIFISYAWGGESEEFVNKLDATFQTRGITIVRDKRDLGFKGRIKAFMEEIGRGNAVIVIVSEKYLKSENCMFELIQISKNGDFYDRIFPIVLENANIYKGAQRIKYIQHWDERISELDTAMRTVTSANLQGFREEIDLYVEIRATIAQLTNILKDMNTLTPAIHTESNFEELLNAIFPTTLKELNSLQDQQSNDSSPDQHKQEKSLDSLANQKTQKQLDQRINEFAATLQPTDLDLRNALNWLYDSEGRTRASSVRAEAIDRYPEAQELRTDLSKLARFENELTNCVYRLHWAIFTDDFRPISDVRISFDPEIYKIAIDIIGSRLHTESDLVRERFQKHIQYFKKRLDANSRK